MLKASEGGYIGLQDVIDIINRMRLKGVDVAAIREHSPFVGQTAITIYSHNKSDMKKAVLD